MRTLPPTTVLLLAFFFQFAQALIVINGKMVSAWPDSGIGASYPQPQAMAKGAATPNIGLYQHPKGTLFGLTLLVDFSDQAPGYSKAEIEDFLNLKGYARNNLKGSVRDYYRDISNGQVDFVNEAFGFYRAKNTKAYYEGGTGYARGDELVNEVLSAFDAQVDFSKYDNDKDGRTEAVSILYAGKGETWGQGLWPHAGGLNQKRDGVTVGRYMMTDMGTAPSLYVFCHECGHMIFGWPDLYGVGDYCLMANRMSETNPVPVNDFYRADQGWIPLRDIQATDNLILNALPNGEGFRFQNPAHSQECFFWSNIKNTGRWSVLKGRGLLLWHFDKRIETNTPPKPLSLAVVQADGRKDLDTTNWPSPGSEAKDFFYQGNKAEVNATSLPNTNWNDGQASGLRIHSIAPINDSMDFSVGSGIPATLLRTQGHSGFQVSQKWNRQAMPRVLGRHLPSVKRTFSH
jgi:M6 family metalloprotease-like protein